MIFPLKESIIKIIRAKCNMVEKENLRYYEDLNDHILYCCEDIETQREVIFNLRELYMSINSNSMGNVMKVLTIVSSIFIPLTFIVGLYGMNFTNMPELKTKYGYFYVLGIMFIIAILMIYYFRRKRWL
jgi:magnesium transporter